MAMPQVSGFRVRRIQARVNGQIICICLEFISTIVLDNLWSQYHSLVCYWIAPFLTFEFRNLFLVDFRLAPLSCSVCLVLGRVGMPQVSSIRQNCHARNRPHIMLYWKRAACATKDRCDEHRAAPEEWSSEARQRPTAPLLRAHSYMFSDNGCRSASFLRLRALP